MDNNLALVCGVLVTFNPDDTQLELIQHNCMQLDKMIIFDNSTDQLVSKKIIEIINKLKGFSKSSENKYVYLTQKKNVGLPIAYNLSVNEATKSGISYILLLDQDAKIERDDVKTLLNGYFKLLREIKNIGAISFNTKETVHRPYDFLFDGRFKWSGFYYSDDFIEARDLINSGMLFDINTFLSVGGYNESYFLDNSDREFTLRLRKNGLRLFKSKNVIMFHNYDSDNNIDNLKNSERSPSRDYYIRDLFKCIPISLKLSFIDFLLVMLLLTSKIFTSLIIRNDRRVRGNYILSGIKDGVKYILNNNA